LQHQGKAIFDVRGYEAGKWFVRQHKLKHDIHPDVKIRQFAQSLDKQSSLIQTEVPKVALLVLCDVAVVEVDVADVSAGH
jgi:hypothetical protein